jgi:hypothetical protein
MPILDLRKHGVGERYSINDLNGLGLHFLNRFLFQCIRYYVVSSRNASVSILGKASVIQASAAIL